MAAFQLKQKKEKLVDSSKCIICQEDGRSRPTRGTHGEGVKTLIKVATEKADTNLLDRLHQVKEADIVYHVQSCYKTYTHIKGRKAVREKEESVEPGPDTVTQEKKRTRQSHSPTPPTTSKGDPFKLPFPLVTLI